MKKLILSIIVILIVSQCFGQATENNANIWYFGEFCGLDFNTGNPIVLTDGALSTSEGCASVCNKNGVLLFYTDGSDIWDASHSVMQNGTGLMGHRSATQSSIIVPTPGNDSLYYVFTVDAADNNLADGLRYSEVNINLNGGLGSVTGTKNVLLHTPACEKITAIMHSNSQDVWLVSHAWGSDAFLTYYINSDSVHTNPVITNIGASYFSSYTASSVGYMKASISGNKIALATWSQGVLELFDFNKTNGTISNCITESLTHTNAYGIEFSPNEKYLYVSDVVSPIIYQYDISANDSLNNPVMIPNSFNNGGALQIGPNGKIYASDGYSLYLGVINKPDSLGLACDFIKDAVYLDGRTCMLGLPPLFYHEGFQFVDKEEIIRPESVNIYPNPTTGLVIIKNDKLIIKNVAVFDIYGREVRSLKSEVRSLNTEVNLSNQAKGIYIIKVRTDKGVAVEKIIKN